MDISIVIPAYNEAESIPELTEWISRVMQENNLSYEILYIDDGSTDGSWQTIERLADANGHIKGIKFKRNFGKSAGLNAGFDNCSGDVVITMDADLQDSPDEIPALYNKVKNEGYDIVSGWKKKRHDPFIKNISSKLFNRVTRFFSSIKIHDFNCGLKAYRIEVVKSIKVQGEMHRYIPLMAKWAGFTKIGELVVQHQKRKYGKTKYGIERFLFGFLDLLSIIFVAKFGKRPMHLFGTIGTLSFVSGFLIAAWISYDKLAHIHDAVKARDVVDRPLFYLALVAIILGMQLFLAGFLAEMLSRNNVEKDQHHIATKLGFGGE
ncbi:MAG: glycosyltransferase family 2 protein [Bacteroidetes bacterium]|nr:glycosyltransferase family 2 protein [Bacteroidota bacterium]